MHIVKICIYSVDIYKLSHQYKLCLIVLLKVDKGLGIGFYSDVLPFCLAINFRIKSCKELLFDAKKIAKQ